MSGSERSQYDIREFGAIGDGNTLGTEAIQTALDTCTESSGTVVVPPGEYLTGPLHIGDQTTLHLEAGAILRFVGDYEEFPTVESRWEGWDQVGFHPCLFISDAENVEITGHGTIDGTGEFWWQFRDEPQSSYPEDLQERLAEFDERNDKVDDISSFTLRPPLLQISDSKNVTVSGINLRNSPFWNTHIVYSENITIHNITIENPADAPNGDGIDIDSSQYVRISDTYINAGDDAICIKSGKNAEGREVGKPASQITVTNCTVKAGHGGVVIGSEMSGDVRDITVTNCTFTGTDRGVRIKTQRDRGGIVEDLRFDNIIMRRVVCPFVINGYYYTSIDSEPKPVDEGTPMVRNVNFTNITAREVETAGFFAGLPEQYFKGISFTDIQIDATRSLSATNLNPAMAYNYEQSHGLFCKSIADISFTNVTVQTPDAPVLQFEETDLVSIDGLTIPDQKLSPAIRLKNVETTQIRGCASALTEDDTTTFVQASGKGTRTLSLCGNHGPLADYVDISDAESAIIKSDRQS